MRVNLAAKERKERKGSWFWRWLIGRRNRRTHRLGYWLGVQGVLK